MLRKDVDRRWQIWLRQISAKQKGI